MPDQARAVPSAAVHRARAVLVALLVAGVAPVAVPRAAGAAPAPGGLAALGDVVSVAQSRALSVEVMAATGRAARAVGASATMVLGGTIGVTGVRRDGRSVDAIPTGYRVPVDVDAFDPAAARSLYGAAVADAIARGRVVLSGAAAARRGARPGDTLEVRGWDGRPASMTVGAVSAFVPSEVVMSHAAARALGADRRMRMVVWGFRSRDAVTQALAAEGLADQGVRVVRSWEPRYADSVLDDSGVKALLGEFAVTGGDPLVVDEAWASAHLASVELRLGSHRLPAVCHRRVVRALQAALDDVTAAGLADRLAFERPGTGCFFAREVRPLGSVTGGSLSRHSWGMAIDLSTTENCLGCVPRLDCRIVQIFRAHGFAWGGNFPTPDGMHFEYVGERRDRTPTRPGAYCPTWPTILRW